MDILRRYAAERQQARPALAFVFYAHRDERRGGVAFGTGEELVRRTASCRPFLPMLDLLTDPRDGAAPKAARPDGVAKR
jgi:hypothetical protein